MQTKDRDYNMRTDLIVIDVDGTLTDGAIFYGDNNTEIKAFSARDWLVLKTLPRLGISVIFLTWRDSEAVSRRASDLGATAIQGVGDKLAVLKAVLIERGVEPEHCAYIGDDLNDFAAMKLCGFRGCPADSVAEIREICDYVSPYAGGHGAVRDICDSILKRAGKYDAFLDIYKVTPHE